MNCLVVYCWLVVIACLSVIGLVVLLYGLFICCAGYCFWVLVCWLVVYVCERLLCFCICVCDSLCLILLFSVTVGLYALFYCCGYCGYLFSMF